jgi:hypothetical protein
VDVDVDDVPSVEFPEKESSGRTATLSEAWKITPIDAGKPMVMPTLRSSCCEEA